MRQMCIHIHGDAPILQPRAGIQSARRPQLNERQEVPPARLPGRRPRPRAATAAAAPRAGTGCPRRRPPNFAGRPARTSTCPGSGTWCAAPSAGTWRRRTSGSTAAARGAAPTCTRARSACRSIPGSRFECMAADPGARLAQERPQHLHALLAAHDRRARNDNPAQQRRAKGVRRSVQVLSALVLDTDHVSLLSEQDRRVVREHLAKIQQPVTLLLFTQTIGAPETALIARQVLDELASLNDLIRVEEAISSSRRTGPRSTASITSRRSCSCLVRTTRGCAFLGRQRL